MTKLPSPWWAVGLLIGLGVGCRAPAVDQPLEGITQACCKQADPKLQHFKGCMIPRRHCDADHKWWMRGSVHCGPVDAANCDGERCCSYSQQYDPSVGEAIDNWAPPGFDKPTNNVTDPDAPPQHTVPERGAEPAAGQGGDASTPATEPDATAPSDEAATTPAPDTPAPAPGDDAQADGGAEGPAAAAALGAP